MKETLTEVKARLGPLVFLDLTGYDLVTAHQKLGSHVQAAVHRALKRKLDAVDELTFVKKMRQGRACFARIKRIGSDPDASEMVRLGLLEYLDCLRAWSEGAGLEGFDHPSFVTRVDGQSVSALDLAMFLQNDNVGCQTGLYRLADGSALMWHGEEDVTEGRFDHLRIAIFSLHDNAQAIQLRAFIYPDLLPGPSFAWRSDGYAQAVDLIILRSPPVLAEGVLANVAAWLALRLGPALAGQDILKTLCPFYDGYALNALYLKDGCARGAKFEFAGEHIIPHNLEQKAGSWLFQVNIFCQREKKELLALENLSSRSARFFERRLKQTWQVLADRDQVLPAEDGMDFFHRLHTSRLGGEAAYANRDVMAHFIVRLAPHEMEAWIGAGPAMKRDRPVIDYVSF